MLLLLIRRLVAGEHVTTIVIGKELPQLTVSDDTVLDVHTGSNAC